MKENKKNSKNKIGKTTLFVNKDVIGKGKEFPSIEYLENLSKRDHIRIIIRGACIIEDEYSFDLEEGKEKLKLKIIKDNKNKKWTKIK